LFRIAACHCCAFLLFCFSAARAEDCRLEQIASLEMTQAPQGLVIPVSIEGIPKSMIVDTGAPLSTIDPRVAKDLQLVTHSIRQGAAFTAQGQQFTGLAVIRKLQIGNMHARDLKFLIYPARLSESSDIAGLLGADFLRHYDIDLDFGAHKLNLFSQNHCPGKVIYWPADSVAVVPMHVINTGHIVVPVTLDGSAFSAVFDTGAFGTILTLEAAESYFGLKPGSPETPIASAASAGAPFYKHVFRELSLEGIAIKNPTIFIRTDLMKHGMSQWTETGTRLSSAGESSGAADMILGMNELRHLHIFVSYKEQRLYVTAASPAPSDSGQKPDSPKVAKPN
jgi:predicted aspartyl protease